MNQNQFIKHFIGEQFFPLFITKSEERVKNPPKDSICSIIFVVFAQISKSIQEEQLEDLLNFFISL